MDWLGAYDTDPDDLEAMSAFYNYSEPFTAECRAYGRLEEAGHPELAARCFGYLLLDEKHEKSLQSHFSHLKLQFGGSVEYPCDEERSRFVGRSKSGRDPPIRVIVKELGQQDEKLRNSNARKLLRDVVKLQQLGIIYVDVGHRQIISGKLADFSTAITSPHFLTTPELNSRLTPEWIAAMEFETFQFSINDYWAFDEMVRELNEENEDRKDQVSVYAFPKGHGIKVRYDLRNTPGRDRVYSFVDPRRYDWRTRGTIDRQPLGEKGGGRGGRRSRPNAGSGNVSKARQRRLDPQPPRWYYDCHGKRAKKLREGRSFSTSLSWEYRDGLIYPTEKK